MSIPIISREEVFSKLDSLEDLPTLPAVAQRVIKLAQDPNVSYKELKKLILTDPPLAIKVVKVANSAAFGRRIEAKNVDEALVTLGLNQLLGVCNAVGILSSFDVWESMHLDRRVLWRHSLATGFLSKSLEFRKMMTEKYSPDLFLCGLIHNIGWIIFDHLFPSVLAAAIRTANEIKEWNLDVERALMGIDHAEIGGLFLKKWNLPEEICTIVQHHHNPEGADELAGFSGVIQIATVLSPHKFPLDVGLKRISDKVPHMLQTNEGEAAIREMQMRYDPHIRQAGMMADMLLGWL